LDFRKGIRLVRVQQIRKSKRGSSRYGEQHRHDNFGETFHLFCKLHFMGGRMNRTSDIELMLLRELEGFEREVSLYPDDESLWKTLPGVSNSAGNLAMHIAGNLQHYVGAVLGGTGYVRNRDWEFARRSGTRTEVVAELRKAAAVM